jgi:hypothetical protein
MEGKESNRRIRRKGKALFTARDWLRRKESRKSLFVLMPRFSGMHGETVKALGIRFRALALRG